MILLLPNYPRAPGNAAHCVAISPSWTEEGRRHSLLSSTLPVLRQMITVLEHMAPKSPSIL